MTNTKTINEFMSSYLNGTDYIKKENLFYNKSINRRKGNIVFNYTEEEASEIKKCKNDIIYFVEKYCKIQTIDGLSNIKLRKYQHDILINYAKNKLNVVLKSRQVGISLLNSLFATWVSLFMENQCVFFKATKSAINIHNMDRVVLLLDNLPFFMKPGLTSMSKTKIEFDTGNKIEIIKDDIDKDNAFSYTLIVDEAAFIRNLNLPKEIDKFILTSTPNGFNKFYEIYQGSIKGENNYVASKVDWHQVSGRDEKWKQEMVKMIGSEKAFNQEYGNCFTSQ